mmetsp:Transcript_134/g.391  ORF Transcript_134/g.391 Transcript_134/m.391 type:complete len:253 (-) Transcript_134:154-912(-)
MHLGLIVHTHTESHTITHTITHTHRIHKHRIHTHTQTTHTQPHSHAHTHHLWLVVQILDLDLDAARLEFVCFVRIAQMVQIARFFFHRERVLFEVRANQRNHLHRFAESHFVCEDTPARIPLSNRPFQTRLSCGRVDVEVLRASARESGRESGRVREQRFCEFVRREQIAEDLFPPEPRGRLQHLRARGICGECELSPARVERWHVTLARLTGEHPCERLPLVRVQLCAQQPRLRREREGGRQNRPRVRAGL